MEAISPGVFGRAVFFFLGQSEGVDGFADASEEILFYRGGGRTGEQSYRCDAGFGE